MTRALFHYTCSDHGAPGIEHGGFVVPNNRATGLAWFTDLAEPDKAALGLTSTVLACDRTECRFRVDPGPLVGWQLARRDLPAAFVLALEAAPGVQPGHWWVATVPVKVIRS